MAAIKHARNLSGEITTRFSSEAIWKNFPMEEHLYYPGRFWHWFDDFHNCPSLTSVTSANKAKYMSYIDTSNTITTLATEKMLGVLRLLTDATDNDAPVITMQGGDGTSVMISDTVGDDMPLWAEFRWRKSSVTDNQCAVFIGICEETRAVDNGLLIDDTGVLADIDHIGFNVAQDNGEELNFAFTKAGQTDTELLAAMDALVASTWVKTGFHYDPAAPTAKRISVYLNNDVQGTYVTGTQIAAATFPDGEEMTFAAGSKNGEGTAVNFDIDWIRLAQKMRET